MNFNMTKKLIEHHNIPSHLVDDYLNPSPKHLIIDKMLNMDQAVTVVFKAIKNKQSISIFSDVDCDGVTATAIMYNYLSNFTKNLSYFYSQRSEGHGINKVENVPKTDILIIVDSSTNDVQKCKEISENGTTVIILDHHQVEEYNPYAILVNPQQNGCSYPNKNISGAGIALKFCIAFDSVTNTKYSQKLFDLAAVGILADVMDMSELENRYIVSKGLNAIYNEGIKEIIKHKKLKDINSTSITLAFILIFYFFNHK